MNAQGQNTQLSHQDGAPSESLTQISAPSTHASLYVGDLDDDVTEAMIYEKFSRIGTIISIRVCRDMISRKSLGYAYVNFSLTAEAEKAIDELNFETIKGRQMRIMWSQRDPSLRKSGVGNLFIKNLDKKIQVRDLYDTFSAIGDILSCKIPVDEKGQSKGYGFVHFLSKEAAETAVKKLDGSILNDKKIFVGYFIPRNQRNPQGNNEPIFNNLYIKNFGDSMTETLLKDIFKEFGEIISLYVPLNDNGSSKGFGFVCFKDPKDAMNAVNTKHQSDYGGKTLYVGRAMKKSERVDYLRSVYEKKKADKSTRYPNGVNLYVKNLDDSIDEEKLRAEFAQHGNITSVKVMTDVQNRSKGFGFVCFTYPDEATKAVTEMNGKLLGGKPLYVALAQRKEERKAHLQNQMIQRQLAYRTFPQSQIHPSMIQAQGAHTFPPQINAAAFQNAAGQMFMYQGFANQANQHLTMPGTFMPQVMANRMVTPMQQNRPARWPQQPNAVAQGPQNQGFRQAYSSYPQAALGNLMRPQAGGMIGHQQANRFMNSQGVNPMQAQMVVAAGGPRMPQQSQLQTQQNVIRNQLQQNPVQYVHNARNIGVNPSVVQMMPMRPHVSAGENEGGQAIVDGSIEEFLNQYKTSNESDQKQLLGEKLYGIINSWYPAQVGKLTGMLLEIDNGELMSMIAENLGAGIHNSEQSALRKKVDAAMKVLSQQSVQATGDAPIQIVQ